MALLLPKDKCATCGSKEDLSRCGGCKVVEYCCRDHQLADRTAHKEACKWIKGTREGLHRAEKDLRAETAGDFHPETVFEAMEGRFWGYLETRPYMRERFGHVEALLSVETSLALEAASEHVMDMHRLCRRDNMGVRDATPHILLRLGKDQECYDFVKWWATTGSEGNYGWEEDFLYIKNADVFEPVDVHVKDNELSHIVAVALIKVRLLLDLKALQNFSLVGGNSKLPREHPDLMRSLLVSPIVSSNKDIMERRDHSGQIKQLEVEIEQLYQAVHKANKHFWPALLNPGFNLLAIPKIYSRGDQAEMQINLRYSYPALIETPNAIDVIRAKVA